MTYEQLRMLEKIDRLEGNCHQYLSVIYSYQSFFMHFKDDDRLHSLNQSWERYLTHQNVEAAINPLLKVYEELLERKYQERFAVFKIKERADKKEINRLQRELNNLKTTI